MNGRRRPMFALNLIGSWGHVAARRYCCSIGPTGTIALAMGGCRGARSRLASSLRERMLAGGILLRNNADNSSRKCQAFSFRSMRIDRHFLVNSSMTQSIQKTRPSRVGSWTKSLPLVGLLRNTDRATSSCDGLAFRQAHLNLSQMPNYLFSRPSLPSHSWGP